MPIQDTKTGGHNYSIVTVTTSASVKLPELFIFSYLM